MSKKITEQLQSLSEAGFELSRRDVLRGAVAAAAVMASGSALAEEHDHDHGHDHHHGMNRNDALVDAAAECAKEGEVCLGHCLEMFKSGDTTLAKCADSVTEMMVMCNALTRMAASNARRLVQVAKVCRDVCEDCEKECRKHEDKHEECKACAESCEKCIRECDRLIG